MKTEDDSSHSVDLGSGPSGVQAISGPLIPTGPTRKLEIDRKNLLEELGLLQLMRSFKINKTKLKTLLNNPE